MSFLLKPVVTECSGLDAFINEWNVGKNDLIITNEYVLKPALKGKEIPCNVIYQEQYGSGEPTDEMVDAMLEAGEGKEYSRIIAIGGGTVIDISKLFVFGPNLRCEEIFAKGSSLERKRSLVIIPTTCGTGSEVTNISIVAFLKKNTKFGLAIPKIFADEAVLIGSLLETLPYGVFATSSIDALIHAMESYVSPKANVFTRALGRCAIEQILGGYLKLAAKQERTLPAGEDMQKFLTASTMAGIAFGNAGCAAVHALSYPIGAIYHVPHGEANYLLLSEVFSTYLKLNADLSPLENVLASSLGTDISDAWVSLETILSKIYDKYPLSKLGIDEDKCVELSKSVIENQQRLLANTPLKLTVEDIEGVYKRCL